MLTVLNETDPRVKRTRRLLLDALAELLHEKSFLSISVQDIAARATVNRATFYAHFDDKYAMFESLIGEGFQEHLESKLCTEASLNEESLYLMIATVIEYLAKLNSRCRKSDRRMDPLVESTAQGALYQFLLRWLARDMETTERVETLASVMSWAIFGAALQWSRGERNKPAAILTAEIANILRLGVMPA